MGRILAVDFGRRRIGLAVCDKWHLSVNGLPTLNVKNMAAAVVGVLKTAKANDVVCIVVGLPLNMDGSKGEMALAAEKFANALKAACGVPVCLFDERLTSSGAQKHLHMLGIKPSQNKGAVDRLAAVFILETYLQQHGG